MKILLFLMDPTVWGNLGAGVLSSSIAQPNKVLNLPFLSSSASEPKRSDVKINNYAGANWVGIPISTFFTSVS